MQQTFNSRLHARRPIITLVGIALLLIAGWMTSSHLLFYQTAKSTVGKVISYDTTTSNNVVQFSPVVSFKTDAGQQVIAHAHLYSSYPTPLNSSITVQYDPSNPQTIYIDGSYGVWQLPVILAVIGIIFIFISLRLKRLVNSASNNQVPVTPNSNNFNQPATPQSTTPSTQIPLNPSSQPQPEEQFNQNNPTPQ